MKRCPTCRRDYYDDSLLYCLDDGNALLDGPASVEAPTAILHDTDAPAEAATRAQIRSTSDLKSSVFDKRVLFALTAVVVVIIGGFFAYRYFSESRSGTINSIAVLPFENRSGSSDSDYLSDGLADSLIYRLSQLPNLKVSPTSSVMRYKGRQDEASQVAKDLKVDAVMSGRLVQIGDSLNISVQLIDARTDKLLWAEQYDRKMSDLLATQREIAAAIVQKLELKLAGTETAGITKKYTNSNDAYQLYLKARYHAAKRDKADMLQAAEEYKQAIALDPTFALAYARLAETYMVMSSFPYITPAEALPPARSALQRALSLDAELSEGHAFMAHYLSSFEFKWAEAEAEFKRALELDPNNSAAHYRYGQLLLQTGRFDASIAEMKKAADLEPLDIPIGCWYSRTLLIAGRKDEAIEIAKKMFELDPNHPQARHFLAMAYTASGMYDQSIALLEPVISSGPSQVELSTAGRAYALAGKRDKALEMLAKLESRQKTEYVVAYRLASLCSAVGDRDKAIALLETSFDDHEWEIAFLNVDWIFPEIHSDPRFGQLVKRLNLP